MLPPSSDQPHSRTRAPTTDASRHSFLFPTRFPAVSSTSRMRLTHRPLAATAPLSAHSPTTCQGVSQCPLHTLHSPVSCLPNLLWNSSLHAHSAHINFAAITLSFTCPLRIHTSRISRVSYAGQCPPSAFGWAYRAADCSIMYSLVYIFLIVSLTHFPTGPTTGPCVPHRICHRTTDGSLAVSTNRTLCCSAGFCTGRFQLCLATCLFHSSSAAASLFPSAAAAFIHRFAMASDATFPLSSKVQSFLCLHFSACPSTCSTSHFPARRARSSSMYPNTSRSPALHQSYAVQCLIFR